MRIAAIVPTLALAVVLGSCTYAGSVDNPIIRMATWFSYVGGEDIKRDCRPGQYDRYRLIYNATWDEQVRAYDLVRSATGEGALLFTTVFAGGGLDLGRLLNPYAGPWGGVRTDRRLDEGQYRGLVAAFERSGLGGPAPSAMRLHSQGFYWVAMRCVNGAFHYNAWVWPGERFQRLDFPRVLFGLDNSGVPVNPPHPYDWSIRNDPAYRGTDTNFELMVGSNGLLL